jgi:hypothetical protein
MYAYTSVANHNSSQSITFLHKSFDSFFLSIRIKGGESSTPKTALCVQFRHDAIPRRVVNIDGRNNSKLHVIFIQIRSIVSETKHADVLVHYEFNMPTDLRIVKACPLVTVRDVQKYRLAVPEEPRRHAYSVTLLWKPHISQHSYIYTYIFKTWYVKDIITTSAEIYWRKGVCLAMHRCPVASDVILMMIAVTPFSCGPQLSSPPARKGTIKTTSPRCRGQLTAPATAIVTGNMRTQFTYPCKYQNAEYSRRRRGGGAYD